MITAGNKAPLARLIYTTKAVLAPGSVTRETFLYCRMQSMVFRYYLFAPAHSNKDSGPIRKSSLYARWYGAASSWTFF